MSEQRYEANRETVGALLSTTSPKISVPEWQRSYSWEVAQIETFWNDLIIFDKRYPGDTIKNQEYFLGSIVLVTGGERLQLLDGQQRLATATILLAVLRDARRSFNSDAASRLNGKYITDYDDSTGTQVHVLSLNTYDRDFFRSEVQNDPFPAQRISPTLKSHQRIRKARRYFEQQVRKFGDGGSNPKDAFDRNLRVSNVLTDHMSMVVVTSSDEDNAAAVFETLNDRGIGLSTADLLRSLLLRRAPDTVSRDAVVAAWQSILSLEGDVSVDQLLRHYWVSERGDVKQRSLYREMKEAISTEDMNSLILSQQIAEAASDYKDLITCTADDKNLLDSLLAIRDLGASVLYPPLLSAYARTSDQEKLAIVAHSLVSLYVRHTLVGGRESTVLEQVVFSTAANLRTTGDFSDAVRSLRQLAPSAEDFENQFSHIAIARPAAARYLLRKIEQSMRATEELRVEGPDKVHLEHIYPQTPPEGRRRNGHSTIVNRIGNLTLLSRRLNTSVKNADFRTKIEKAYRTSEIRMTHALAEIPGPWTVRDIDQRQQELAKYVFDIWKFPDETREQQPTGVDDVIETPEVDLPEVPDVVNE